MEIVNSSNKTEGSKPFNFLVNYAQPTAKALAEHKSTNALVITRFTDHATLHVMREDDWKRNEVYSTAKRTYRGRIPGSR